MQEFIETLIHYVLMVIVLVMLFFMLNDAWAIDYSEYKELYMANEAGGYIVLTLEDCKLNSKEAKSFKSRAYATESDGTIHEGCWEAPSTEDAPPPNELITIVPLVNVIWHTGDLTVYPQNAFSPTKTIEKLENAI